MASSKAFDMVVLIVLFVGIVAAGFIFVSPFQTIKNSASEQNTLKEVGQQYIVVEKETPVPSNTVFVDKRYTKAIDPQADVVVEDSNGDLYVVKSGNVLVGKTVVSANDEKYQIQRLDRKQFSIQ